MYLVMTIADDLPDNVLFLTAVRKECEDRFLSEVSDLQNDMTNSGVGGEVHFECGTEADLLSDGYWAHNGRGICYLDLTNCDGYTETVSKLASKQPQIVDDVLDMMQILVEQVETKRAAAAAWESRLEPITRILSLVEQHTAAIQSGASTVEEAVRSLLRLGGDRASQKKSPSTGDEPCPGAYRVASAVMGNGYTVDGWKALREFAAFVEKETKLRELLNAVEAVLDDLHLPAMDLKHLPCSMVDRITHLQNVHDSITLPGGRDPAHGG